MVDYFSIYKYKYKLKEHEKDLTLIDLIYSYDHHYSFINGFYSVPKPYVRTKKRKDEEKKKRKRVEEEIDKLNTTSKQQKTHQNVIPNKFHAKLKAGLVSQSQLNRHQEEMKVDARIEAAYHYLKSIRNKVNESNQNNINNQISISESTIDKCNVLELKKLADSMKSTMKDQNNDFTTYFHNLCKSDNSNSRKNNKIKILGNEFLIPSNSAWICSDLFTSIKEGLYHSFLIHNLGHKFSLIVMDPPWGNKSATRGGKYETFESPTPLLSLPIDDLLNPDPKLARVAIWVTNKSSYHRFIIEKAFPAWGLEYETTSYWLKVTNEFEPVRPFYISAYKPYEVLIIGKRPDKNNQDKNNSNKTSIPFIFTSVPGPHSSKPPIESFFKDEVQTGPKLELFARNLRSGWCSWGDEVLKFQSLHFYS